MVRAIVGPAYAPATYIPEVVANYLSAPTRVPGCIVRAVNNVLLQPSLLKNALDSCLFRAIHRARKRVPLAASWSSLILS